MTVKSLRDNMLSNDSTEYKELLLSATYKRPSVGSIHISADRHEARELRRVGFNESNANSQPSPHAS